MPKKDFSQIAFDVARIATGESPKRAPSPKQEAGRKGGLKGGKARMDSLTADERRDLAMRGVEGRKKAPAGEAGALPKK